MQDLKFQQTFLIFYFINFWNLQVCVWFEVRKGWFSECKPRWGRISRIFGKVKVLLRKEYRQSDFIRPDGVSAIFIDRRFLCAKETGDLSFLKRKSLINLHFIESGLRNDYIFFKTLWNHELLMRTMRRIWVRTFVVQYTKPFVCCDALCACCKHLPSFSLSPLPLNWIVAHVSHNTRD